MGYFIQKNGGEEKGPFSAGDIAQSIREGRLRPDANVREESQSGWTPAMSVREIADLRVEAPSPGLDARSRVERYDGSAPFVAGPRLGRLAYLMANLALLVVEALLLAIYTSAQEHAVAASATDSASVVLALLFAPLRLWVAAMRCRDLGREGSECLRLLIPFYNLYFGLVLLFKPGRAAAR